MGKTTYIIMYKWNESYFNQYGILMLTSPLNYLIWGNSYGRGNVNRINPLTAEFIN